VAVEGYRVCTGGTGGTGGGTGGKENRGTGTVRNKAAGKEKGTGNRAIRGGTPINNANNPILNQPRSIVPQFQGSASTNQQILDRPCRGNGDSRDLQHQCFFSAGFATQRQRTDRILLLGYVPAEYDEGSCHTLKSKD